jgi:hypothetical protein
MRLHDGESFIELEATEQMPAGTPGAGDARFDVHVCIRDGTSAFSGNSWAWVEMAVLVEFTDQLRKLEESRSGQATLVAMSPGELELEIRNTDLLGHMAVFGKVEHDCYGGIDGPHRSGIQFGIPFDPGELPGLLREFARLLVEYKPS